MNIMLRFTNWPSFYEKEESSLWWWLILNRVKELLYSSEELWIKLTYFILKCPKREEFCWEKYYLKKILKREPLQV
jgi:hypothetical protein